MTTWQPARFASWPRRQVRKLSPSSPAVRFADLERRYRPAVSSAPLAEQVKVLADALSADGYAASASAAAAQAAGEQLCQHHCPVAHVAAEYPQLCEAETEAFGRLLGTPVQRPRHDRAR